MISNISVGAARVGLTRAARSLSLHSVRVGVHMLACMPAYIWRRDPRALLVKVKDTGDRICTPRFDPILFDQPVFIVVYFSSILGFCLTPIPTLCMS